MKNSLSAAPGFRPVLFAIVVSAMALLAYMPAPACALPGGAGQEAAPAAETDPAMEVAPSGDTSYSRQGMWIWHVDHSEGGSVGAILARAYEIDTGPAP